MARVTVEDCVLKVPNRFELVMMAAQRARDISAGAPLTVEKDNDKNPVIALREIADETVTLESLREALIKERQKIPEADDADDEIIELMAGEEEYMAQATAQHVEASQDDEQVEEAVEEEILEGDEPQNLDDVPDQVDAPFTSGDDDNK